MKSGERPDSVFLQRGQPRGIGKRPGEADRPTGWQRNGAEMPRRWDGPCSLQESPAMISISTNPASRTCFLSIVRGRYDTGASVEDRDMCRSIVPDP